MWLYNPTVELGGDYLKVTVEDRVIEAYPGTKFEVKEDEGQLLRTIYRFLKDIDDPRWKPDWHTQKQKSNWIKRLLWRRD